MKNSNNIIDAISEEVKKIAHRLQDSDLSLTEAEELLRETTRDWERRLSSAAEMDSDNVW